MKIARLAAILMLAATPVVAVALPVAGDLGGAQLSTLSAEQVTRGGTLSLNLPWGTRTVRGVASSPAAGMVQLAARSIDGNTRLYAFVADGAVRSADVYGDRGHLRLTSYEGQAHWTPAPLAGEISLIEPQRTSKATAGAPSVAARNEPGGDGKYEVRVLMLYDAALATELGGAHEAEIEAQRLIAVANGIYETNGVPVHLVVGSVQPYATPNGVTDFYELRDSMVDHAGVRGARDSSQSDLVVLLVAANNSGLCGLSSGFNGDDHGDPPADVDPERDAFNVVAAGPVAQGGGCIDHVLAHEIGHSLSAGHDWVSVLGNDGVYWKPYAHALPCVSVAGLSYFSLMFGNGIGPGGGRGDIITSAAGALGGLPCGSAGVAGLEATQADNVRAMSEAAPYVAAYRGAKTAAASGGGSSSGGDEGGGAFGGLFMLVAFALASARPRSKR